MRQYHHPDRGEITLTGVLAALSDPARLSIVSRLAGNPEINWGDFDLDCAKSTLSHHLKVLRDAGVVTSRTEGNRCAVSLRADLEEIFPGLLASVLKCAAQEETQKR